jgi:hypothetical protein
VNIFISHSYVSKAVKVKVPDFDVQVKEIATVYTHVNLCILKWYGS